MEVPRRLVFHATLTCDQPGTLTRTLLPCLGGKPRRGWVRGRLLLRRDPLGVYPNGDNAKQFAKMVEWGLTPLEAIQAATRSAAEALDKTADAGAIAPGRYGDLVAVDGDPLADVRVLEKPVFVMKGGEMVRAAP